MFSKMFVPFLLVLHAAAMTEEEVVQSLVGIYQANGYPNCNIDYRSTPGKVIGATACPQWDADQYYTEAGIQYSVNEEGNIYSLMLKKARLSSIPTELTYLTALESLFRLPSLCPSESRTTPWISSQTSSASFPQRSTLSPV